MRTFLYSIFISGFFICMLACHENREVDKKEEFRVIGVIPSDGFSLFPSGLDPNSVCVKFSTKAASVNMMINGASVDAFTNDNRTYTIPGDLVVVSIFGAGIDCIDPHSPDTRPSLVTLTIAAESETGLSLKGYTVDWTIAIYDWWPPTICGDRCVPKNGAVDMDPKVYPEKLVIAFNEPVIEATVVSVEPRFDFTPNLTEDSMKLEIRFVDYVLPYGTEFKIEISAIDRTGNIQNLQYSFTTVSRDR